MSKDNKPRVYVACLAAYNNGRLHGEWIDAAQDADEIGEEVQKMLAASPVPFAEEWAIHDYEGFGGFRLEEYTSFVRVSLLGRMIDEHGEAFALWAGLDACKLDDLDTAEDRFTEDYHGVHETEKDFAMAFGTEVQGENGVFTAIGSGELPDWAVSYMDWDDIARDLFVDHFQSARGDDGVHVYSVR